MTEPRRMLSVDAAIETYAEQLADVDADIAALRGRRTTLAGSIDALLVRRYAAQTGGQRAEGVLR